MIEFEETEVEQPDDIELVKTEKNESVDISNPIDAFTCPHCSKTNKTHSSLRKHLSVCAENNDYLKKIGEVTYVDSAQLKNAAVIGKGKKLISCKECNKSFKFMASYKQHQKLEHSKKPDSIKCKHCNVRCPDAKELDKHVQTIHKRQLFQCPNCPKTFVRQFHVVRHLDQKGCGGKKVKEIACDICGATFGRKDNLLTHLRIHLNRKSYICKICKFQATSFNKYINHYQTAHNDLRFECDICGKVMSSRPAMVKHLEIHGDKKFACSQCGYETFTIEVMKRHVLRHINNKPHQCRLCPSSFIQIGQLRQHMKKHAEVVCSVCSMTFSSVKQYSLHAREHEGLKPLQCTIEACSFKNRVFPNQEALQQHIAKHYDKSLSKCMICAKEFGSEMNLKRHVSTHALDRPRRCMYCIVGRAYVRGEMLLRHIRSRHKPIFREHLLHVRKVMGNKETSDRRVSQSELDSILILLDTLIDRIMEQNAGEKVLYGGMQEVEFEKKVEVKKESNPLMSEEELSESLSKLLTQMVDSETLECLGWPQEGVDNVLEKVISNCGQTPADKEKWSRVQCLRENAKYLFLHVMEDKTITRMLTTHTIDQVVTHILKLNETDEQVIEVKE